MTAPSVAPSKYDQLDKSDQNDPIVNLFRSPLEVDCPPPLLRAHAPPQVLGKSLDAGGPPPLLRRPAPPPMPFKFTDEGPTEKLKKGDVLQPDTEYNRIHLPLSIELRQSDAAKNVTRFDEEGRKPYVVEIEATMTRIGGAVFDTGTVKKQFPQQGAARLGAAGGEPVAVPEDWRDEGIMWVCYASAGAESVTFYSAVCQINIVHHSSFGDGVIAAGEWIVRKGKLTKISANSGHYRPTIDALYRAVLHLACARQPDTTIFLYDTKGKRWADVAWEDFIGTPTGGGRYTTHPDSPVPKSI